MILDIALEEGTRKLHRLTHPADWVTGAIWRVSIALARGEKKRAGDLATRVLRYDPLVRLEPGENSPQLRAALDEIRKVVGPSPPLTADALGDACREYPLMITVRQIEHATEERSSLRGSMPVKLWQPPSAASHRWSRRSGWMTMRLRSVGSLRFWPSLRCRSVFWQHARRKACWRIT